MHLCMNWVWQKEKKWEMHCLNRSLSICEMCGINVSDHGVLLLTLPENFHTMSHYSFCDCFIKNITDTGSKLWKRGHSSNRRMIYLFFKSFSFLMRIPLSLALWSTLEATIREVISHLATSPVLQAALWQINPVAFLYRWHSGADGALWTALEISQGCTRLTECE